MQVETRPHPRGEQGTTISIEEAAKRSGEARLDPRVRAWSIEKIVQAGNPPSVQERAQVLLDGLRRERIYIEDPTDAEFMPSAACTLKGCEGLMFLGEDCDGLLIAWLGACGSIGIFAAVVGHSYDKTGSLTHVLGAIWDGNSSWVKGDPSTKQKFGTVSKPTREKWVSVHDGRTLCDKLMGCDPTKVEEPMAKMRSNGDFVGVVGVHSQSTGAIGDPPATDIQLVAGSPSDQAVMRNEIASGKDQLTAAMYEAALEHEKLVVLREYFNRPIVDMDIVHSGQAGASPDEIWSQTDEDKYQKTLQAAVITVQYSDEAVTGRRHVARRVDNAEVVILGSPSESFIRTDGSDVIVGKLSDPKALTPTGTVGNPAVIEVVVVIGGAIFIIVAGYLAYSVLHEGFGSYNQTLQTIQLQEVIKFFNQRIAAGDTPEQASAAVNVVIDGVAKSAKANLDAEKASPINSLFATLKTVLWATLAIGVVVGTGYAVVQLAPLLKSKQTA